MPHPKNYIQRLQAENAELLQNLNSAAFEIQQFRAFLASEKFTGTENGERKDWIATRDVDARLMQILESLHD